MDINWIVDAPFRGLPVGDPDTVAVSEEGKDSLTYSGLRERRNRWIDVLLRAGVRPGDRVGVLLLNSVDYIALYFAISRIGAVVVRVNFRLTPPELRHVLLDSGCTVVVAHTTLSTQVEPIRDEVPVRRWLAVDNGQPRPEWAIDPDLEFASTDDTTLPRPAGSDLLMLMYTSGTTGRPKGVMWSHDNALWLAMIQSVKWRYEPTVWMTTGPLYHAGAFEVLLLPALFMHGTAVFMSSGGMSTRRIVDAIGALGVTHVLLYPFMLYDLLQSPCLPTDLPSLQAILCGGDPVQQWALEAAAERFPTVEIHQGYGLTEGGTGSTCLDHEDARENAGSVGRPMPLTDVMTVDADGNPAAPGVVGEIWVRSPTVAIGYWNNPDATAETFVDGWCRTGDLGSVTENGFLVVSGRAKDMFRSGGENVYPAEVESVLAAHPGVARIAVVGVPDERYLEVGCAVVVAADGADIASLRADLVAFAGDNLAGYKRPRHWVFVAELPVNAAGKVQKQVLRETYAGIQQHNSSKKE
ncbi:class I adenylate-forming enzyme family protein [Nocardia sp. NPDC004068]|uniref:class I adenylate-forming enzyme family protein n=1 Tax=Nocardia sp. NPDC004068 TaxID=3364303 RepID=UPI0036793349